MKKSIKKIKKHLKERKVKRYMVTLPIGIDKILNDIELGNTKAEKIRVIVLTWLAEKSIISGKAKKDMKL